MSAHLKRRIVVAAVVLGAGGLGGSALAASSSGGSSFLGDVANRLGISQAKLQSAIDGAVTDRLDQLVKEGKLTQAQANAIEKQIERHGAQFPAPFSGPFGPFPPRGAPRPPHVFFGFGPPRPFFGFGFGGPIAGPFQAAATYLGVSDATLARDLRSGKTLAAIATAKGRSVSGLEAAMIAPAKAKLDAAVTAGRLSKVQESRILRMLSTGIHHLVTGGFPPFRDAPMWGGVPPATARFKL
jgi:predicted DNA-binding protein (UPF0251 family)